MMEFTYKIKDREGIHARPAGQLVKLAASYPCAVVLSKDSKEVDAKRIFAIMGLAVKEGEEITIRAEGEQEVAAIAELEKFVRGNL